MFDNMFYSLMGPELTAWQFLLCIVTAMVLGTLAAIIFSRGVHHSSSWTQSLAMLPPVVALVIMLVNGNIGAGLAVAGTFALVRFRSLPGSAREISGLFFAVAIGLACGMGYVLIAAVFFVAMALFVLVLNRFKLGEGDRSCRQLKIMIPENLDYDELFDDLFEKYTKSHELLRVRTTNMGTIYELSYVIAMKKDASVKAFIDDIRCRNGNLNIICGRDLDRETM